MNGMTISELQAYSSADIDLVYISEEPKKGFFRFDPSDTTSIDDECLVIVDALGRRYLRNYLVLTPQMFGAYGDGVNDDTAAIQLAVDYSLPNFQSLFLPAGEYKITDSINFGIFRSEIYGEGPHSTKIIQHTSNIPIFNLEYNNSVEFSISNIGFFYKDYQPASNSNSIAIYFNGIYGNVSWGFYNFTLRDLLFERAFKAIANRTAGNVQVWGASIRDCVAANISGSFFSQKVTDGGSPNLSFDKIYVLAEKIESNQNIFEFTGCDTVSLDTIEINKADNGPTLFRFVAGSGIVIGNARVEFGTFNDVNGNDGEGLIHISDTDLMIENLMIATLTIDVSNEFYIFKQGGGNRTNIFVQNLKLHYDNVITSGGFFTLSNGDANKKLVIDSITGLERLTGLCRIGYNNAAGSIWVNSFMRQLPVFVNNSNYTAPSNGPKIILVNTTLIATIYILLPVEYESQSNLFFGLRYKIIRNASTQEHFP